MARLIRKVPCKVNHIDTELFVILKDGLLRLPPDIPTRFQGRLRPTSNPAVLEVASVPFSGPTVVTRHSLACEGLWITFDDTVARGGVSPCVFGIPLATEVIDAWALLPQQSQRWTIRVGYHGTDEACMKSIARENVLRPSFGQLGTGVYTGSFWKACRFAVRDQNYAFKLNPCVIRVLWLCDTSTHLIFPRDSPCPCEALCAGKSKQDAQACGHEIVWSQESRWQSGELIPTRLANGRWITRNEEWVCSVNSIQRLQQIAFIDVKTVDGPHYNPLQRDIQIH